MFLCSVNGEKGEIMRNPERNAEMISTEERIVRKMSTKENHPGCSSFADPVFCNILLSSLQISRGFSVFVFKRLKP